MMAAGAATGKTGKAGAATGKAGKASATGKAAKAGLAGHHHRTPSRSPTERQTLQGSRDIITAVAEKHETAETKRPTDLITAVAAVGGANKIG